MDMTQTIASESMTAAKDKDAAQDESVASYEELLGTSFEIWTRRGYSTWEPESPSAGNSNANTTCPFPLSALFEEVHESGQPCTAEASPGQHWLALPLKESRCDTTHCTITHVMAETHPGRNWLVIPQEKGNCRPSHCALACFTMESPQLLLQLVKGKLRDHQQRAELTQLHEENGLFLKQVSEDFEELTFLRSIAERLALEDCSHNSNQLISFVLPQLGEATPIESLYYFDFNPGAKPQVNQQWFAEKAGSSILDHDELELIVERFGQQAFAQPIVKNRVQESDLAIELPNIREFILVAAYTGMGPQGWLLAVNRTHPPEFGAHKPLWNLDQTEFGTSEASLISTATAMLASHAHNVAFLAERESLLISVVRTLVSAVESKDNYTRGHSERVALYAKRLATEAGYDPEACERLYLTGLLHDIGKIGISDAVLTKEGALTPEEFAEIQKHPDLGWAILRELKQMSFVLPGVLHHHERVDGKGYPDQLEHSEIPQDGLVLALADAFDAMTSDRPYRHGMSVEKAVEIFKQGAGSQWDAQLIELFLKILPDIVAIKESYSRPPLPERQRSKKSHPEVIADSRMANCPPVDCAS